MNDARKNYDITQQKFLAVVWIVLLLRPYIEGSRLVTSTDHQELRRITDTNISTGRMARWQLRPTELDFEVQH